jgi:hypothetical protein
MKTKLFISMLIVIILLAACGGDKDSDSPAATATSTPDVHALAAANLTATSLVPTAEDAGPMAGFWSGTGDGIVSISFEVEGQVAREANLIIGGTIYIMGDSPIHNGAVAWTGQGTTNVQVTGTFTSSTSITGTVQGSSIAATWSAVPQTMPDPTPSAASPTPATTLEATVQAEMAVIQGEINANMTATQAASTISGVFASEPEESQCSDGGTCYDYRLLRFYPDGTVLDVSTSLTETLEENWSDIDAWFNPTGSSDINRGVYTLSGDQLEFSTTSVWVTLDYTGTYTGDGMSLTWYSHYNGNSGIDEYTRFEGAE